MNARIERRLGAGFAGGGGEHFEAALDAGRDVGGRIVGHQIPDCSCSGCHERFVAALSLLDDEEAEEAAAP